MKVLFTLFFVLWGVSSVCAQTYPVSTLPDELKSGAEAVIRYSETEFEYVSPTHSRAHNTLVVTILTRGGEHWAEFSEYTNLFSSLSGFSGEIYDPQGRLLRKIKKSELHESTFSASDLTSDIHTHTCEPAVPNPPFTVKYTWDITTLNAVWRFPTFVPQPGRSVGVEKAVYRVNAPADLYFHTKAYNFTPEHHSSTDKTTLYQTHTWSVENLAPLPSVPFTKPLYEVLPLLYFSPDTFVFDGVSGSMSDWASFGAWKWKLLDRSGATPDELKAFVSELTKEAKSEEEIIRILYDYLAITTRYVSIQIGIGGFQPLPIGRVHKTKYGDCKALSNYLRGMLAVKGITAHYAIIGVDCRSIPRDFVSPSMSNHAILMIPSGRDTLWVECTNAKLPLGYRHRSIVGQNALVHKDGTAEVITVPHYADSLNRSEQRAEMILQANSAATAHIVRTSHLHRFEDDWSMGRRSTDDRLKTLYSEVNLPLATLSNPLYREEKGPIPNCVVEYDLETPQIGSRTGDRLFIDALSFRTPYSRRFPRGERTEDICVQEGFLDIDITHISLPDDAFRIEALPRRVTRECKYGSYFMTCRPVKGGIKIERRLLLRRGTYDKAEYAGFKEFIEAVSRSDNSKIVLVAISSDKN